MRANAGVIAVWGVAALAVAAAFASVDRLTRLDDEWWLNWAIAGVVVVGGALWSRRVAQPAWRAIPAVLLALGALPWLSWGPAIPSGGAGPSVVLITLDTFRVDRLGELTPNLGHLMDEGVTFTQAVTTAPLTAPAHASVLTGLEVRDHGLVRNGAQVAVPTVVEAAAARGWPAAAFLSARVLDRHTGLQAGFTHYDDAFSWGARFGQAGPSQRKGGETVARAVRWAKAQSGPNLLWVHLYDAHLPYTPDASFVPSPEATAAARQADREQTGISVDGRHAHEGELLYNAEIRTVDAAVGTLLAALPPETIVFVVGDHGEALGEQGYWFNHGALLHEAALHVPMIVRWQGKFTPGSRDSRLMPITKIAALLDEATGGPPAQLDTPSVLAYTPGQQNRNPIRSSPGRDAPPAAARRYDGRKIVVYGQTPAQFYDLTSDPGELTPKKVPEPLTADVPELQRSAEEAAPALDAATASWLQSLGYVE